MSDTTPLLLITNAGLAVASVANPQGPFIHITGFQIGSAYGYEPTRDDPGLNGNLLYSGVPTSYESIGNNTLNILCEIPPDAGPFEFGEVALFLDGGVMFAKAVFDEPQTKFSSLGTNVVSSYLLNCLLKLQQSTAVFQIDTINAPPAVVDIYQWSDVYPPGVSANPDVPLYNVRELSPYGDSSLLVNSSDAHWSLETTYARYNAGPPSGGGPQNIPGYYEVASSSTTWVQIAASALHPADLTVGNRGMVLQTPDGFFRSVSSIITAGANYQFNLNCSNDGTYNNSPLLNAPQVGSEVTLYRVDRSGGAIYYSQIVDPPPAPALATVGVPGLAYGSSGTYMPSPGVIQTFGLLHSPAQNTGRVLGSGDDLNNTALASGVYTTSSSVTGFPGNMPVAWDGEFVIMNFNQISQTYYPYGTGGGDALGNGGYPIYYRAWTGSAWTSWFPIFMSGKNNPSGGHSVVQQSISNPFTMTITQDCIVHIYTNDGSPSNTTNLYRNGVQVSWNTKGGSKGYGRKHHDMGFFLKGDTLLWQYSTNDGTPTMNILYI